MRDYAVELERRVAFIQKQLEASGTKGIVFGNSGGKDCALVGILCKKACDNVLSVMMPCGSKRNFGEDMQDAIALTSQFGIANVVVDLSGVKPALEEEIAKIGEIVPMASANIAPRLRMTTLYTIAQSRNSLVAGTGNRSERFVGYFTKWGDGACDFNPIADLTVGEVYEFLRYLHAPQNIITKAPSAGLFEGQTDEKEMGVSYAQIDEYILKGTGDPEAVAKIARMHAVTEHKRQLPPVYTEA